MQNDPQSALKAVENLIDMWHKGRKQGVETIIELLYLQTKMLAEIQQNTQQETVTIAAEMNNQAN